MRNSTTSAIPEVSKPADQIDQAGADQVADALDIGHDARDQHAPSWSSRGRQTGNRRDVGLHFLTKLRNQPLRRLGKQLRQGERS